MSSSLEEQLLCRSRPPDLSDGVAIAYTLRNLNGTHLASL